MNGIKIKDVLATIVVFGLVFLAGIHFSRAADGLEIVPTWTAENFYPSDYRGKPLPSIETRVVVSTEIIKNGKIVDASNTRIKWYVDEKFYKEGNGLKEILFYASKWPGGSHFIRIEATQDNLSASKIIEIPVVSKEAVVESSLGSKAPANSSVVFVAVPYFFNVGSISDLDISWKIQKRDIPGENKNTLFIQFGTPKNAEQGEVKISAFIKERANVFQKAVGDFLINIEQ